MSNEQQGADVKPSVSRREFVAATAGAAAVAAFGFSRLTHAEDTPGVITQIVTLTMKEGQEEKVIATLKELTAAVKENEPGVLVYIAHRPQTEPNKIIFFEVYKDAEAAANHSRQPHMAKMFAQSRELFDGGMKLDRLDRVAGYSRES